MESLQLFLADAWFSLIALFVVLYVVLDGFVLGVGIMSLFAGKDHQRRDIMMASLGYIWDANETWLVILVGALFGAFPLAYGIILNALYIPMLLLIFGLIFRGVAFEFREISTVRLPWNLSFGLGSLLAALAQGFAMGGIIDRIQVEDHRFAGGIWDWLSPFSALVAGGVVVGYALLGATYLILKTEGNIQRRSYEQAEIAAYLMLLAAVGVSLWTALRLEYVAQRWFALPHFFYFSSLPLLALVAFFMLIRSLHRGYERSPFGWSLVFFFACFLGLVTSLYPYIVPTTVTIGEAAASAKTMVFMLMGIGMLVPIMLGYNAYQYRVFRGKVHESGYGER